MQISRIGLPLYILGDCIGVFFGVSLKDVIELFIDIEIPNWLYKGFFYLTIAYLILIINKTLNGIKQSSLIDRIHDSEHSFQEALHILNSKKTNSKLTQAEEGLVIAKMQQIVDHCRVGFKEYQGIDVSVNLKIIKTADLPDIPANANKTGAMYASTLFRCPSDSEKDLVKADNHKMRSNEEKFILEKKYTSGKKIVKDVVSSLKTHEIKIKEVGYKINSAFYSAAYIEPGHFWITNDISQAIKKDKYYSTSDDYEDYYDKIAVFLVQPPLEKEPKMHDKATGILVADSLNDKKFDKYKTSRYFGYYAHKLHIIIELLHKKRGKR